MSGKRERIGEYSGDGVRKGWERSHERRKGEETGKSVLIRNDGWEGSPTTSGQEGVGVARGRSRGREERTGVFETVAHCDVVRIEWVVGRRGEVSEREARLTLVESRSFAFLSRAGRKAACGRPLREV